MTELFWMIHATGGGAPAFRHFSRGAAEQEAERLARANPGQEFVLLEAKESFLLPRPPVQRRFIGNPVDATRLPGDLGAVFGREPRRATPGPHDPEDEVPF